MTKENRLWLGVWLALVLVSVVVTGFGYTIVRQNYMDNASDPQVDLARQVRDAIEEGAPPGELIRPDSAVDISENLSPFAMVYDKDRKVVGASGRLSGNDMIPPAKAFETAVQKGKNYFVWQPQEGVVVSAVLLPAKDSFVLVGRNIELVWERVERLGFVSLAVLLILFGLVSAVVFLLRALFAGRLALVENTEVVILESGDNTQIQNDENRIVQEPLV